MFRLAWTMSVCCPYAGGESGGHRGRERLWPTRRSLRLKDRLAQEKVYLEDEIRSELKFEEIIGKSASLRSVLSQIETVAPTDSDGPYIWRDRDGEGTGGAGAAQP